MPFSDEEKRAILAQARAYASSEREHIDPEVLARARELRREQEETVRRSLETVERECRDAYQEWTTSADATPEGEENAWDAWLNRRLAEEREFIWAAVGEALARYADQERQDIRNELETRINQLRADNMRDRSADIQEQKRLLADVKHILDKIQRREFGADESSSPRMH
jgi:hypothetical protein